MVRFILSKCFPLIYAINRYMQMNFNKFERIHLTMKVQLLLFPLLLYSSLASSQGPSSTVLTWMKGDNTINQLGIYGTKGITATENKPGARDFSATWKD